MKQIGNRQKMRVAAGGGISRTIRASQQTRIAQRRTELLRRLRESAKNRPATGSHR